MDAVGFIQPFFIHPSLLYCQEQTISSLSKFGSSYCVDRKKNRWIDS